MKITEQSPVIGNVKGLVSTPIICVVPKESDREIHSVRIWSEEEARFD
jgi:hypothetical protein